MPANVIRQSERQWRRRTKPASLRGIVKPGGQPWLMADAIEEHRERARLLCAAKGPSRPAATAALRELRDHYRLRLPIVESRWGLFPGWL